MEITCDNCYKVFNKPSYEISPKNNYCSRDCWRKHFVVIKNGVICDACGKYFYKCKSHAVRQVNNFCCKECWQSYDGATNKNKDFFSKIDCESKAYWLGFVCADGWLDERDKCLGIGLQRRDRGHLEKFAEIFDVKVKDYQNGENRHSRCMVYSKTVFNDLIAKGVIPRKSKLDNDKVFDFIPEDHVNHFVRGWFDGDGSIYYATLKGKLYPRLSIVGTESCLTKLRDILVESVGCNRVKVCKHKSIFSICWGGRQVIDIRNWFLSGANIFLERKKQIFEDLEEQAWRR